MVGNLTPLLLMSLLSGCHLVSFFRQLFLLDISIFLGNFLYVCYLLRYSALTIPLMSLSLTFTNKKILPMVSKALDGDDSKDWCSIPFTN